MSMQTAMNDVLAGLGINGTCVRAESHRHLAFYDVALELRNGAVSKLKKRETAEAIAMALKTKTVPIMRLIPEDGVVRLQVALKDAEPVGLMDLYEGEWLPDKMVFPMLLGEDDEGSKMWMDMNHNPHLLVAGGTGSGKALEINTPIPTPDGWKRIIDLQIGDIVFDQFGKPTKVLATTGEMHNRPCYKLTFSDGSEIVADEQHEWITLTAAERKKNYNYTHRLQRQVSRKRIGGKWSERAKTAAQAFRSKIGLKKEIEHTRRTTKDIANTLFAQSSSPRPNHSIRTTNALYLPEKDLCIDPYILGVWLGDGNSGDGRVTTTDDAIVVSFAEEYAIRKAGSNNWRAYCLRSALREIGVLNNKHIPEQYLRASKDQRLALLQGLMDSDGTASKTGACIFTNTNKTLVDNVIELARTLGFGVSINRRDAKLYGRVISDAWNVSINATEPLFRLQHKLKRQKFASKYGKCVLITKVEKIASVPVCCIQTEAGTYLCGERMIPTHNSSLLHTLIANALYVHALRTRNVWLYLGDPKRVEFTDYEVASRGSLKGIVRQVASSYDDVIAMLNGLYNMMELRYKMLQQYKMRSIEENPQKFPLVLCIIDEVSDLMGQQGSKKELEQLLVKLAQKGRAAGIFLVLSTQRPSVDVVTGLIKANFPGRIACKTASRKDSEVVLDRPGAETLLGRGDAVLQNMKHESVRFQVAYTIPQETIANFNWVKRVAS
jgi:hypothetical protein